MADKSQIWVGMDTGNPDSEQTVVVFNQQGTFEALYAAWAWCTANGISYGSTDITNTIGLLYGDYHIAKWKNLTKAERLACDGTMTGDFRHGPVTIRIGARP